MYILCNVNTCRSELKEKIWVTRCFHSFCEKHALSLNTSLRCTLCGMQLDKPFDIVRQNAKPTEGLKAMLLVGLDPETVHEMVKNSLTFWNKQMEQEIQFQNQLVKTSQDKMRKQLGLQEKSLEEEHNSVWRKCKIADKEVASLQKDELVHKCCAEGNNRRLVKEQSNRRNSKRHLQSLGRDPNVFLYQDTTAKKTLFLPSNPTSLDYPEKPTAGENLKIRKNVKFQSVAGNDPIGTTDFVFDPK